MAEVFLDQQPTGFTVSSGPRPVRVAYLLDRQTTSPEVLDAVFAECHSRWGGAWSLLVPCTGGELPEAYRPWLTEWDPDVICPLFSLAPGCGARLHEELYPALLTEAGSPIGAPARIDLGFTPLSSLSLVARFAADRAPWTMTRPTLIDADPSMPLPRWFSDSFGVPGLHLRREAEGLADQVSLLTLIAPERLDDPRQAGSPRRDYVTSAAELTAVLAADRDGMCMADLSSVGATAPVLHDHAWSEVLTIVVGDSFDDRLLFWNARHHMVAYAPRLRGLRIGPAQIGDAAELDALAALIRARNFAGGSGPARMHVRSCSIGDAELAPLAAKLADAVRWQGSSFGRVSGPEACIPEPADARRTRVWSRMEPIGGRPVEQVRAEGSRAACPKPPPPHLDGGPPLSDATGDGVWMLDVDIIPDGDGAPGGDRVGTWLLPRRLRLASQFIARGSVQDTPTGEWRLVPRVNRRRTLSVAVSGRGRHPSLTVPRPERAIAAAIRSGGTRSEHACTVRRDAGSGRPWSGFAEVMFSDKGQHLRGAARLFRGYDGLIGTLADGVWHDVLGQLGGDADRATNAATERLLASLRKLPQLRTLPATLDDRALRTVAERALRFARDIPDAARDLPLSAIETIRNALRPGVRAESPHLTPEEAEEWERMERAWFLEELARLSERKVFAQGIPWRCEVCLHRNWAGVERVGRTWTCDACSSSRPATVDGEWSFRANGYLTRAMREHGLGAVVWCLSALSDRARQSFYFLPSVRVTESGGDGSDARSRELDLICVADGRALLCEVKSSARVGEADLRKLAEAANLIRPDTCVLAVKASGQRESSGLLGKLQALLDPGIEAEVLTLRSNRNRPPEDVSSA